MRTRLRALGGATAMAWRAQPAVFVARLALTVVTGLAPVAAAWLLRAILDDLSAGRHRDLVPLVIALALASGLQAILPNVGAYLSAQFGRAIERLASATLFAAVGSLNGLRRLEDPGFQDRLRMAGQAGRSGPGQVFGMGISIVQSGLTLAGFLVTLILLNPVMAAVVVVATVPGVFAQVSMSRRRAAMMMGISHAERREFFYANLLSSRAAAKEIRLFGLGPFFQRRMLAELNDIQRAGHQVDRRELVLHTGLAVLAAAVAGGGLWWSVEAAAAGRLTLGDVSVFVAALVTVGATLAMIINNAAVAYQALLMFEFYGDIVNQEPDLPIGTASIGTAPSSPATLRRGITVDDVWFRYGPDQPWILRGVSLFIPHGACVGLVGHNGAGKSTLVSLMCRFYDPDRGRILWDGVDLRDMDIARLRDRMSVVFQDFMSYELTAAENIAVGDLAAGDEALAEAARRSGIHDALAALPKGYDTLLTQTFFDLADRDDPQTGVLLSGGQWQRLALARSFLRGGRDLVILDEPSSGLDAEAEFEIHRGLREHRRGRATVLISHRLNAVRDADRIVVLLDGVVAEEGNHEELMARQGTYARLFSLQARGYADEVAGDEVPAMELAGAEASAPASPGVG